MLEEKLSSWSKAIAEDIAFDIWFMELLFDDFHISVNISPTPIDNPSLYLVDLYFYFIKAEVVEEDDTEEGGLAEGSDSDDDVEDVDEDWEEKRSGEQVIEIRLYFAALSEEEIETIKEERRIEVTEEAKKLMGNNPFTQFLCDLSVDDNPLDLCKLALVKARFTMKLFSTIDDRDFKRGLDAHQLSCLPIFREADWDGPKPVTNTEILKRLEQRVNAK